MKLTGLPPIVFPGSKILVLGTFPSVKSLEKKEYYGNPINGFWKILSGALGVSPVPASYKAKKEMLRKHSIALWDMFEACERRGSEDSAIRNACVSDIPGFLKKHPAIRKILIESRTAEKIWRKQFEAVSPVPGAYVPSPSSLARLPLSRKIEWWRKELETAAG